MEKKLKSIKNNTLLSKSKSKKSTRQSLSKMSAIEKENKKKISAVIRYAKSLVNVPYRWHRDGDKIQSSDKFWAKNGSPVSRSTIDKEDKCIVCTGLINLMRRFLGLTIPGLDGSLNDIEGNKFPGTTGIWFAYLLRKDRLETLDVSRKYPKGTLLLRDFEDIENQGHVAVIIDEKGTSILDQRIIHAYAKLPYKGSEHIKNVGKTGTMKFKSSHYYGTPEGYYTHICLPENWLLKN